jgi:hypothetical protein
MALFRLLIIAATITIWWSGHTYGQAPEEARLVAQKELNNLTAQLSNGPVSSIYGGRVTQEEMARAILGEGFLRKWGVTYENLAELEPEEILNQATDYTYFFPVNIDSRCIGTINVKEDIENPGTYFPGTRWRAHSLIDRIVELQAEFKIRDGYSVILLGTDGGSYAVIQNHSKPAYISPIEARAARKMNIDPMESSDYPIVSAEKGFNSIRESVRTRLELRKHEE